MTGHVIDRESAAEAGSSGSAVPPAVAAALVPGFRFSLDDGIGTLTFDRPARLNALSAEMWDALPALIAAIDAEPEIGALILRGAGGAFSAGSDIGDLSVPLEEFWKRNSEAEAALAEADVPTVAAIEGICIGGGTELAAACDVRIGQTESRFGVTAAKLGLVYPPGPTRRLVEVFGAAWARYLLVTGRTFNGERAYSLGFLHELSETPYETARAIAATLVARSALSQTGAKRIIRGEDVEPTGAVGAAYDAELPEGQEAFFAKRPPEFGFRRTDWEG